MTTPPTTSEAVLEEAEERGSFRFDLVIPSWEATDVQDAVDSLMDSDVPWFDLLEWRITDRKTGQRYTVSFVNGASILTPIVDSA